MSIPFSVGGLIGQGGQTAAGNDTQITIWGLYHYLIAGVGTTVSVQIIGQDCGDFTVGADGSVIVPIYGTTIGGVKGVIKLADLVAASGLYDIEQATPLQMTIGGAATFLNVPIVIGRAYVAQGQRLRAIHPNDLGLKTGPGLGIPRQTKQFAVLLNGAVQVRFGTSLTPTPAGDMVNCLFPDETGTALAARASFSGVWREPLDDPGAANYDSAFAWQIERPYPFAIMAVSQFTEAEDFA